MTRNTGKTNPKHNETKQNPDNKMQNLDFPSLKYFMILSFYTETDIYTTTCNISVSWAFFQDRLASMTTLTVA